MSEHICKNCGEKNKQKDFCSMTCYLDFEKKKVDLASEAVNNYDRLRKANEELVKILKEMAECSYFDDAEGPELRAQNANLHRLAKHALQSSESDK